MRQPKYHFHSRCIYDSTIQTFYSDTLHISLITYDAPAHFQLSDAGICLNPKHAPNTIINITGKHARFSEIFAFTLPCNCKYQIIQIPMLEIISKFNLVIAL